MAQTQQQPTSVPSKSELSSGGFLAPSGVPTPTIGQVSPDALGQSAPSSPPPSRLLEVAPSAVDLLPPALQRDELKKTLAPRISLATTAPAPRGAASVRVVCTIEPSSVTDTLNAVATPWAERAYLVREDGSESPPLVIKADTATSATSLEIEVVLQNLRRPLQAGDSFPVTFVFNKSGPVRVMVRVKKQAD